VAVAGRTWAYVTCCERSTQRGETDCRARRQLHPDCTFRLFMTNTPTITLIRKPLRFHGRGSPAVALSAGACGRRAGRQRGGVEGEHLADDEAPTMVMPSGRLNSERCLFRKQWQRTKIAAWCHKDGTEAQLAASKMLAAGSSSSRSATRAKSIIMIAFFLTMPIRRMMR